MAASVPSLTLNDGIRMPMVGLGAWMGTVNPPPSDVEAFKTAIDLGYRHFDTAASYNTEGLIGTAVAEKIKEGRVKREDIFITTKLRQNNMQPDNVVPALKTSLRNLQMDYVDNYIIHWPVAMKPGCEFIPGKCEIDDSVDLLDIWKSMEECKRLGLARTIGLSNFNRRQVQRILDNCSIKPSNDQVEVHPFHQNKKLRAFCKEHDIAIVCYAPLVGPGQKQDVKVRSVPDINEDPTLSELANKYGVTNRQVALRFLIQEGLVVIPKSSNPTRQLANISIFNFELSNEDLAAIRSLDRNARIYEFREYIGESKEFPFNDEY